MPALVTSFYSEIKDVMATQTRELPSCEYVGAANPVNITVSQTGYPRFAPALEWCVAVVKLKPASRVCLQQQ
jgi:hypothetical protein